MTWASSKLHTPDGASVQLYTHLPNKIPKGIVQINHGMAEHAGRYQRVANSLVTAGYGVYAHDHRGHGHTTAPGTSLGIFARRGGWDAVISDVRIVNDHIRKAQPETPIICFGHSMGSIIAFNYALHHPGTVDALALWNSGVETGALSTVFSIILRIQRMFKGSDVPSGLAQKATFDTWNKEFAPNRTGFDWLSSDDAEVDKYISDPLCGFPVSIGMWQDVLAGIYFAADDANLKNLPDDLPIHLLAGQDDPCSERGRAVANIGQRMEGAGLHDVTLSLLPGNRHESLNEINRDETLKSFITWMDERFST